MDDLYIKEPFEFSIEHDKQIIRGDFYRPYGTIKWPVVIIAPEYGYPSSLQPAWSYIIKSLVRRSIAVFIFDYSDTGLSDGSTYDVTPTAASKELNQVICLVKKSNKIDPSRIGLLGSSFGGLASLLYVAQNNNIKALALKSPVSDYCEVRRLEIGDEGIQLWKKQGWYVFKSGIKATYKFYLDCKSIDIVNLSKKVNLPCLIVHGKADVETPAEQSLSLARYLSGDVVLYLLSGGDHNYQTGNSLIDSTKMIVNWFCDRL